MSLKQQNQIKPNYGKQKRKLKRTADQAARTYGKQFGQNQKPSNFSGFVRPTESLNFQKFKNTRTRAR